MNIRSLMEEFGEHHVLEFANITGKNVNILIKSQKSKAKAKDFKDLVGFNVSGVQSL